MKVRECGNVPGATSEGAGLEGTSVVGKVVDDDNGYLCTAAQETT